MLPIAAANATSMKRKSGGQVGAQRQERTRAFWYDLCTKYRGGKWRTQVAFLRSSEAEGVSEGDKMGFSRAWRQFQNGTLENSNKKKEKIEEI